MSDDRRGARERHEQAGGGPLDAVPGLVRVAASAWWHTTEWTVETSVQAARRLLGMATAPESASDLAQDLGDRARGAARDLAGVGDIGERMRSAVPEGGVAERVVVAAADATRPRDRQGPPSLRDQGEELLRRSSDVRYEVEAHPAYERILEALAPDEGRILRLLLLGGPQPAVDVRTGGPVGLLNSKLIAQGFSMIGPRAGLRYTDRVPSYLNNLYRLGLIWFSRETLHDPLPYQVLEAQPEVLEAMRSVRYPKIVRRSIQLTPFGEDFCRDCLALEVGDGTVLPGHGDPHQVSREPQPPAP
jgi:hypothetical protein